MLLLLLLFILKVFSSVTYLSSDSRICKILQSKRRNNNNKSSNSEQNQQQKQPITTIISKTWMRNTQQNFQHKYKQTNIHTCTHAFTYWLCIVVANMNAATLTYNNLFTYRQAYTGTGTSRHSHTIHDDRQVNRQTCIQNSPILVLLCLLPYLNSCASQPSVHIHTHICIYVHINRICMCVCVCVSEFQVWKSF